MSDIRIVQGDAVAVMKEQEPDSFHCILTDPPYCSGAFSEAGRKTAPKQGLKGSDRENWFQGDNAGTAGLAWLLRLVAFEASRILVEGGILACFMDWRQVVNIGPAIESAGMRWSNWVIWDKGFPGPGQGFRSKHESLLIFAKGVPVYHRHNLGNVLRCNRVSPKEQQHPTQKPVELLEQVLSVICPPDGRVLDPFAGSGSTGVACERTGRSFLGVERATGFVSIAQERLSAPPGGLFGQGAA